MAKKRTRFPQVGDVMTYFPCVECDAGIFPESNRAGCLAFVVAVLKRGIVSLKITDRQGREHFRERVPVAQFDKDCSIPHCRPKE